MAEEYYEEEYEEASPDQQLNIASYFIMSSPTGEVHEVIKDVKSLVSDDVLNANKLEEFVGNYNKQQFTFTIVPDSDDLVIITPYGEVAPGKYWDPSSGNVYEVDQVNQKCIGVAEEKIALAADVEAYRAAIEKELRSYLDDFYREGKAALAVYGTDDGNITVCISARNVKLSAFWAGGMRSKFELNVKQGSTEVKGMVKTNAHYFDNGNVQLHTNIDKASRIEVKDVVETAKFVRNAIEKIESDFQNNLEEIFVNLHSQTFKAMRRFLPVSGQPMNWDTTVHSLASEITK